MGFQFYQNMYSPQYTIPEPLMPSWTGISADTHQLPEMMTPDLQYGYAQQLPSTFKAPTEPDFAPSPQYWYTPDDSNQAIFISPLPMSTPGVQNLNISDLYNQIPQIPNGHSVGTNNLPEGTSDSMIEPTELALTPSEVGDDIE
ncbi:hypothetical protein F5Y16DRAFT_400547 [Xylariaceae sp. FL0255]|nr:hypothetical protein F5Y16DRAFT_400547 [Xylariaceae sp. FL0255]